MEKDILERIEPETAKSLLAGLEGKPDGCDWHVYQNSAFDSQLFGHIVFLLCGPGCTHETPPLTGPDGPWGCGWRYVRVGALAPEEIRGCADA